MVKALVFGTKDWAFESPRDRESFCFTVRYTQSLKMFEVSIFLDPKPSNLILGQGY